MIVIYLPRERAREKGIHVLSDYELLALVFRTGTKNRDVLDVAKDILKYIGGIEGLGHATCEKLCCVPGVGESKAYSLLACVEISKRIYQSEKSRDLFQIASPDDCYSFFQAELKFLKQEVFIVILLNAKNQIIEYREIYRGGLHHVEVHPREIFKVALEVSAAGIILLHNHPSGDATPSQADLLTTRILIENGEMIGVPIIDHIIIGNETFASLKAMGEM